MLFPLVTIFGFAALVTLALVLVVRAVANARLEEAEYVRVMDMRLAAIHAREARVIASIKRVKAA